MAAGEAYVLGSCMGASLALAFAVLSGADGRHTVSASWTLKELMPQSELWDVLPPRQTGANTLAQILRFKSSLDSAVQHA